MSDFLECLAVTIAVVGLIVISSEILKRLWLRDFERARDVDRCR